MCLTFEEVQNNFIHKKWYSKKDENTTDTDGYYLSVSYYDMIYRGYGNIFNLSNHNDLVLPHQFLGFYCLTKEGYLKIFTITITYIDKLSLNDLMQRIQDTCKEFNLKFVALGSEKYSLNQINKILGDELKFEYNSEGIIKLYY